MRPHLEYSNVIWSPRNKKDIQIVSYIQRRASRVVVVLENLNYEELLIELQLPSLVYRRLRGDLFETYKYYRGCYDSKNLCEAHDNYITRGNDFKIKRQGCRKEVREGFSV